MRNQGLPLRAEFRGLPAVPVDQVVTGLIPHEPPSFQTPAALALLSGAVCVVTGQRGVGKTQVAAAYARQRVRDGWLVAWISSENEDQTRAGMVELADRLDLGRPEGSPEVSAARVRNHLQSRSGPALLVFDNVVSLDSVRPYLPSAGPTQVVITSTVRGSQIGHDVPVDVFEEETALRFLRAATGLDDDVAAAELAREVGHLPLALAQAAARIRAGRWNYAKYLENFRRFPAEKYLSRRDGDPYPLGAATAILMALEPFHHSALVRILAVLSPDGVSRQVFGDSADDELALLHEASLVELAGDSSVLMHRLVQRVVRDRHHGGSTLVDWAATLLLHRVQVDGDPWARRHFGRELVRQIEALWTNVGPTAPADVVKAVIILRLWATDFLTRTADFAQAELIVRDVYAASASRLSEDQELFRLVGHVSSIARAQPGAHLAQLRDDLAVLREELGTTHPDTLTAARLLGQCHLKLNQADEAVAVLEPWRDHPADSRDLRTALECLGMAYTAAGQAEDAIAVLEPIVRQNPPAEGADPYTLSLLGDAYLALGRFDDARAASEEVWETYRRTAGPDHPLTLFAAGKLGTALACRGEIELATALLKVVLTIATEVFGPDHMTAVTARSALEVIQHD